MKETQQMTTLELKLEKLRQVCERAPDNAIGLLALAETAFRRGLKLEALEAYQRVLKHESVAEAHLCMAQMYHRHGLLEETTNELLTLFQIEPSYPEAHVFARQIAQNAVLPEELSEYLRTGCGVDELALARVRLSIARSLVVREGQELVAIQESQPADPTYSYYIGETRKRLNYYETVLSQLGDLEETHRQWQLEQERLRVAERVRQQTQEEEALTGAAESAELPGEGTLEPPAFEEGVGPEPEVPTLEPVEALESDQSPESESLETEAAVGEQDEIPSENLAELSGAELETVSESPVPAEPELPAEPALWDDPPRYASAELEAYTPAEETQDDTLDLTPTLIGDLPEPELPPAEPEWEQTAEEIEPEQAEADVQEEAGPEDSAPAAAPNRDYGALYAPAQDSLDNLIQTLAKTRSVSSVFLVNREGHTVSQIVKDPVTQERVADFMLETIGFLESFASTPQYWVLECAGGIVVIQSVDAYHFLLIIGQTGANFGALRYTMDRIRPSFEQTLQPALTAISSGE